MKKYKKTYNLYTAWNYEREVEDMNRKSERGWHLIRGKSFSHKYEYNPEVCYRYQLDYQPGLTEPGRYLETYYEQGWEMVGKTFNGWYYFRKLYDPSRPKEQYKLYTDTESLKEMNGRWAKIATALTLVYLVFFVIQLVYFISRPTYMTAAQLAMFLFIAGVFAHGILLMRNPKKKKTSVVDYVLGFLFFAVLIGGTIGNLILLNKRPHSNCDFCADYYMPIPKTQEECVMLNTMEVKYSDNYFLDLKISAEQPVKFQILDDAGETVYTAKEADYMEKNCRLRLKKGTYRIYLSDFEGGRLIVTYSLE